MCIKHGFSYMEHFTAKKKKKKKKKKDFKARNEL